MKLLPRLLVSDRILDAVALPVLSVIQALFLAIAVFATREAFEAIHKHTDVSEWTLIKLVGSGIAIAGLELLQRRSSERLGQSYANSLRILLYGQLASMYKCELESRRLGALSLRFVGDLSAARNWFSKGLPRSVAAFIIIPSAAAIMWQLDSRIAIICITVIVLSLIVMSVSATGFYLLHKTLRSQSARIAILTMERIAIAPQLDLLGRTQQELKSLDDQGQRLITDATRRAYRLGALYVIPQLGVVIAGAIALWQAPQLGVAAGTVAAIVSMLALLSLPLKEIARAWDYYNAWQIAKQKAELLLAKDSLERPVSSENEPCEVVVEGTLNGAKITCSTSAGSTVKLVGGNLKDRSAVASLIAGFESRPEIKITYNLHSSGSPSVHFIGEIPVALQGSIRRALTLGVSPRPKNSQIIRTALCFGLGGLLTGGEEPLKNRIAEGARNLSAAESIRVDLTRAALGDPGLIIIDTARLLADPEMKQLLGLLKRETDSTIIVVDRENGVDKAIDFHAINLSA